LSRKIEALDHDAQALDLDTRLPLLHDRLEQIATHAATAAEALDHDAQALDLHTRDFVEMLASLDGMAARLHGIVERLAGALDPGRIG
jgi:hypothetical protein